jgi:hypothetical protein
MEPNFDFYFPYKVLQSEEYSPIESIILKNYYRNEFLKLMDKVRILL